jgi:thiol-disulfide isomerase/thioredoxin
MTPKPKPPPAPAPDRRAKVLMAAGGALLVLVIAGLLVALLSDDDGEASGAEDQSDFGSVQVDGEPLPTFDANLADSAIGLAAPTLTGSTPTGDAIEVGGGGEPTLVVFLAHWCPHCQAEVPVLVEMADDGAFDGVRTVAVLTGTNPDAPNYPPAPWLEREGWPGDVMLDDQAATAAAAFGISSYPYLVMLDGDGQVTGRLAGEQPTEAVAALVDSGS